MLFVDLVGSTEMGERLDPEALTRVLRRYFDVSRSIVESHGGTIMKFMGDAVVAVFGLPVSREDDPLRAIRATWDLFTAVHELNVDFRASHGVELVLRAGLNTGEVAADANALEESFVFGDTANTAARLEQHAAAGTMLIGELTYQSARHGLVVDELPPLDAKGKSEPVRAFRVVAVESVQGTERPLSRSTLIGRRHEIEQLHDARRRSMVSGTRMVTILGEPGLGKSRLLSEFTSSIGGGVRLIGRCLPYGDGAGYWPVREVIRQAADDEDPVRLLERSLSSGDATDPTRSAQRVARTIGLLEDDGPGASLDEVTASLEHVVRHLAVGGPLVIVIDDLHWAGAPALRLVTTLSGIDDVPLLLIAAARREFVATHPGWVEQTGSEVIELQPLDADLAAAMMNDLVTGMQFDSALMQRIHSNAGGNPLFLEQTVQMLLDEELVEQIGGLLVAKEGALDRVPSSLQSLIGGRIDQLAPDLSRLLARASVLGASFGPSDLALVADSPADQVTALADRLIKQGLFDEILFGGDSYGFRHNLIRDAAYDRLGKRSRADLHQRVARHQQATSLASGVERDESIGYHLERAYLSLADLRTPTDEDARIAFEAASCLSSAGRQASELGDVDSSAELLGRAISLLEGSELRPRLRIEMAIALLEVGRFDDATEALALAESDDALRQDDARLLEIIRSRIVLHSENSAQFTRDAHERGFEAMHHFASIGDHTAELQAGWLVVLTSMALGAMTAGRVAIDQLLESVRPGASPGRLPGMLALNLAWGPTPADQALAQTARLLDAAAGDPAVEPLILAHHAHLLGISDRADEARAALGLSRAILERQGQRLLMWGAWSQGLGRIEVGAGQLDRAEAVMREGHEALVRLGERGFASAVAGQLATLLAEQGRFDEVEPFVEACLRDANEIDVLSHVLSGIARALVAESHDLGKALELVDESIRLAMGTEWPSVQGQTLLRAAQIRSRHEETRSEAIGVANRAHSVFASKGHIVGLREANRLLDELRSAASPGNTP